MLGTVDTGPSPTLPSLVQGSLCYQRPQHLPTAQTKALRLFVDVCNLWGPPIILFARKYRTGNSCTHPLIA